MSAAAITAPRLSEASVQRAVVDYLRRAAKPGVMWTHMPAGELRDAATAGKLKGMGVQAGWPDLLLVADGCLYGLELKTERGRVSRVQTDTMAGLARAGVTVAVAYGLDEALACLKRWGLVR